MTTGLSVAKERVAFDEKGQVFSLKVHWRDLRLKIECTDLHPNIVQPANFRLVI